VVDSVIGKSIVRIDVRDKATGRAQYGADLSFSDMLYGKTLRSPHPHAIIKRIDTSDAADLAGVRAVLTAEDIPGVNRHGAMIPDQWVLVPVGGRVRMIGDPIALVAADRECIAEEALRHIAVEYEPLDPIPDIDTALKPDCFQLHDEAPGNLCGIPWHLERGDVKQAFAEADIVVENVFRTPRQEHAYLEPESGVAFINNRGEMEVHAAVQSADFIQAGVARILDVPAGKVHSIAPAIGGGFGGKTDMSLHAHAALLALKTGRPVSMVWSRTESFLCSSKRTPIRIHHKMGSLKDGTIIALQVHFLMDGGAYASGTPLSVMLMGLAFTGPYEIPNILITGQAVYTNNPFSGAMRGYDIPQAVCATEVQVDELIRKAGIDLFDFHEKNLVSPEKFTPTFFFSETLPAVNIDGPVSVSRALEAVIRKAGPLKQPDHPYQRAGRGICSTMPLFDVSSVPQGGTRGTYASAEMLMDGSMVVRTSAVELGQGLSTMLAQVAAQELGIDVALVAVISGDTRATTKAGYTSGSRQTYCSGNALLEAVKKIRATLLQEAAVLLAVPTEELVLENGRVRSASETEKNMAICDLASACYDKGINMKADHWFAADHAGRGHTFAGVVADVVVDLETGVIDSIQLVTALDAGKAINPQIVIGQLLGGEMQGLGYALLEDMTTKQCCVRTPTFMDYLIPTAADVPVLENILIEEPYPTGPHGARGVAEFGFEAVAPAVINAVYDAVGVRFTLFPLTPEKVLRGIRKAGGIGFDGTGQKKP